MVLEWREREHEIMDHAALQSAHNTSIEDLWAAEVLLYIAHAGKCPLTGIHGQLLGS